MAAWPTERNPAPFRIVPIGRPDYLPLPQHPIGRPDLKSDLFPGQPAPGTSVFRTPIPP